MRPFPHADRHDLPQLFGELFPCEATAGEDVAVGFVDPLRQVVVGNFEIWWWCASRRGRVISTACLK